MPRWPKTVLTTIGALDAALCLCGLYFLFATVWDGVFALWRSADAPYFRIAFGAMTATNSVFLMLFLLAAFQLLWLRTPGVIVHATTSAMLIVYGVLIVVFLATGGRVGMSVAAATGVGNMGIAPLQCFNLAPYVYPITSTVLLFVARRKMVRPPQTSAGIALSGS